MYPMPGDGDDAAHCDCDGAVPQSIAQQIETWAAHMSELFAAAQRELAEWSARLKAVEINEATTRRSREERFARGAAWLSSRRSTAVPAPFGVSDSHALPGDRRNTWRGRNGQECGRAGVQGRSGADRY